MPIVRAEDGYPLWYEALGNGPALVFPARLRTEFAALGAALSAHHRVVRYKPRQVVGVLEADPEAGGSWDPAGWSIEQEIADLHTVADAAGVAGFVLAGYSGMAALAAFLTPASDRAAGLLIGGFPLLAG